ncbi:KptA family-domain-containing protein [Mycena maculata]|uniref:2'-phosphotransferase n=1 Tax=Mycena maculata TaxID=230809 RepID=A0AAD7MGU1_9AGAR|nr:KptA family-domain-containing protein [Mycena maculata]
MFPAFFQPRCRNFLSRHSYSYSYSTGPPAPKRPWPDKRSKGPDPKQLRVSHQLSYLLRHGAHSERLPIRSDGYVNVDALLAHRSLRGVDFAMLENIVRDDAKSRYHLKYDPTPGTPYSWWIRANQGHSMRDISLDMRRVKTAAEVRMAVHGTTMQAWESISKQGLSRMGRNHIHLAQGFTGDVVSGMRNSSQVLIFVDVARALEADIPFYLSANFVVLTPGNEFGFLPREFFSRVERVKVSAAPIPGWEPRAEEEQEGMKARKEEEGVTWREEEEVEVVKARAEDEGENEDERVNQGDSSVQIVDDPVDEGRAPVDAVEEIPEPAAETEEERKRAARERRKARREEHARTVRRLYALQLDMF